MFKTISRTLIGALLLGSMVTPQAEASHYLHTKEIRVFVDGKRVSFDVEPTIIDSRTLVPVRATFEALGAEVEWEPISKTVKATKGNVTLQFDIGHKDAQVNGETKELDVPARVIGERSMIPLRFVSEAFETQVGWEYFTRTITISSLPTETVQITKMIKPDLFEIERNGQKDTLRLIGVRTVDPANGVDHENGIHSEYLSWFGVMQYISKYNLKTHQADFLSVKVSFDHVERDVDGNLLGYIFLENGNMLNAQIIQDGSARTKVDSENKTWLNAFYFVEDIAFGSGRGGWDKQDPFPDYQE